MRHEATRWMKAGAVMLLWGAASAGAAVLTNVDFEAGNLNGWTATANQLTIAARTNDSFNRSYGAAITGRYVSSTFITNKIAQSFTYVKGDTVTVEGFAAWKKYTEQNAAGTGYVEAILTGAFGLTQGTERAVFPVTNNWAYFNLAAQTFGVKNSDFEQTNLAHWAVACDHLTAYDQTNFTPAGYGHAMRMVGSWTNWSFNQVYQTVSLQTGDVVQCKAKMRVDALTSSGPWAVAGIKLEKDGGGQSLESVVQKGYNSATQFIDLAFNMTCTQAGTYVYRAMVLGGDPGTTTADVYFDDLSITTSNTVGTGAVELRYVGHSGGAGYTSSVEVCFDALTMRGSKANVMAMGNVLSQLFNEAQSLGTNVGAPIPAVPYAGLGAYGLPSTGFYPASVEVAFGGLTFKNMNPTGNTPITCNFTIYPETNGHGYIEFDRFQFLATDPNVARGASYIYLTNAPYFALGSNDNKSTEFGNGPFPDSHTFTLGDPLTNFPKRMATDANDPTWPFQLIIQIPTFNFSTFDATLMNMHFVIDAIATNGAALNYKNGNLSLTFNNPSTNLQLLSQKLHMGWATDDQSGGAVDYQNVIYQDHNLVYLRAPWLYNLVDDGTGWFMQQAPRGSATLEPIDLFGSDAQGNWVQKMYEESLFTWGNAASGVRSIFDDDKVHKLKGPAATHVGFKVGHRLDTGTGDPGYPEVVNIRGNGYFRMTDYGGVMAGSFRPVASDVFGLYKTYEDAPLITKAYARVVPRTTNSPIDNSYGQAFMLFRSKTNQAFAGTMQMDMHFTPDETTNSGTYFDLGLNTWAHKAHVLTNHGPLALFSQVSMYWRGKADINDYTEGHDLDVVMVKKADGEWVTHQVLNPPTNTYHRSLAKVKSNDVVYIMQQDRGDGSYGHSTEAPYRRASAFEITILNDGGLPLSADMYEDHTESEINDNVNITVNIMTNIAAGAKVNYGYRYRTMYAPGVFIVSPNESSGSENWSNDILRVEFIATDGESFPLKADIYYGNGRDTNWTLINTNVAISVPNDTHRVVYDWNTANVATGAYYLKVVASRVAGSKPGFDVSNTRIQVNRTRGLPKNAAEFGTVVTNAFGYVGTNMSFESSSGALVGWAWNTDTMTPSSSSTLSYDGGNSARLQQTGAWNGWGWNSIWQDVTSVSGELLQVSGRVLIKSLAKTGTNWLVCGVKMESTNPVGRTTSGIEFNQTALTNSWLLVNFTRTSNVTGTDRIHLWCAGHDGSNVDVYFDNLVVTSTNTGRVVTNATQGGYWGSASGVSMADHKALSFFVSGTNNTAGLRLWVADTANVTNWVYVTNHMAKLGTVQQRADIPWTAFTNVNKSLLRSAGFYLATTNTDLSVTRMRSIAAPFTVRSAFINPPRTDRDGMPMYNPGRVVTNVMTISNMTAVSVTGVNIQAVQEYGADAFWWDDKYPGPSQNSPKQRRGDRLCGTYDQCWTNVTIPASGRLILTNIYAVPMGRYTQPDATKAPFWVDRNFQGKAQIHLVIRKANGDNCYDNDAAGFYAMSETTNLTFTAPVSQSFTVTNLEDNAKYIECKATDADGDAISFNIVQHPTQGWLDPAFLPPNPGVWYNISNNWSGTGIYTYVAYDAYSTGNVATVRVVTVAVDDLPVGNPQSVTNNEDAAKAITLTGYDIDSTGAVTFVIKTQPAYGSVSGTVPNVTYRPNTNYAGLDSFTFCAKVGTVTGLPSTITITNINLNDAPVASNQSVSVTEEIAKVITLGGSDIDSTNLTRQIVANPAKGVLSGTGTNRTYTPNANQTGADSFTFRITDDVLTSAVATVSITIAAVNDAPAANTQAVSTAKNTAKAVTLTATDIDSTNVLSYSVVTNPANGVLSGTAPNVTYTPNNNWTGVDSFSFKASDGSATSLAAKVTITVTNSPTTIYVDDSNTGMENGTQANPYNTIMEGVNAALSGDTVLVITGLYGEVVVVSNRSGLTLRGTSEQAMLTNGSWKIQVLNSVNCLIEGFTATGGNSGVYIAGSTNITLARNSIKNITGLNTWSNTPIYAINSMLNVADNILTANYGGQAGGGGTFVNSHLVYESNDVINCTAWNSAGGIYLYVYGVTYTNRVRQNYFKGCQADFNGAIYAYVYGPYGGATMIDHNTIIGCGPDYMRGGAIQLYGFQDAGGSPMQVLNNVIKDPTTPCCDGGVVIGLYINDGRVYAANNIFSGYNTGYSIYGYAILTNTVVEYNDQFQFPSGLNNVTNGVGNITNNPAFVNAGAEDFTLQTNSPCINAGNPATNYNDANGTRNDMGVYGGNY